MNTLNECQTEPCSNRTCLKDGDDMFFLRLLSLCLFLFQLRAYASADWPSEVKSVLSKWQKITSISYDDSSLEISAIVVKRWEISHSADGDFLNEKIPLSFKLISKNPADSKQGGTIDWTFTSSKLSEPLLLEPFVRNSRSGSQVFKILEAGENRIVFDFTERKFKLILLRTTGEPNTQFLVNKDNADGFSVTPNGGNLIADESMKALFNLEIKPFPGPRYLLNHDIRGNRRKVIVNLEFPEIYIKTLRGVLDEWNSLLGQSYFVFSGKQILNPVDCISDQILCIQWKGGERFTWTSFHGTTEQAADPGTGTVIGGIIYLFNDANETSVRDGTIAELALVENPKGLPEVALGFTQFAKYSQIWRRESFPLVKWLLLHEMGHFFGWNHNFAGAYSNQTALDPETVMGYPPFNLISKFDRLGPIDRKRFQAIYNEIQFKNNEIPFCGDLDINPLFDGKSWSKKIPECLMWSAGAADWIYLNSQLLNPWQVVAGWNVYQALTPKQNELGSFVATLGFIAKGSQSDIERAKATQYLCAMGANDPKILPFVAQQLGFEINCR